MTAKKRTKKRDGRAKLLLWGARDGVVMKALASHQCGPGSDPGVDAICGLSLLLVLSFAPRGFSPGTPVFPSPQKPKFPNSNSTRNQVDEEPLCGCATSKSLLLLFFFNVNQLLFGSSRWCRRRRCLSSLVSSHETSLVSTRGAEREETFVFAGCLWRYEFNKMFGWADHNS